MSDPSNSPIESREFDASMLEQLACPACLGALQLAPAGGGVRCGTCLRVYPLIDRIPVRIADRAMQKKPE
jgi:uncharacterized protein YbaR (Trm112 family)